MKITNNSAALDPKFAKAIKSANDEYKNGMAKDALRPKYQTIAELNADSKAITYSEIDFSRSKIGRDQEVVKKMMRVADAQHQSIEEIQAILVQLNLDYCSNAKLEKIMPEQIDTYLKQIAEILNRKNAELNVWGGSSSDMTVVSYEDILKNNTVQNKVTRNYTKIQPSEYLDCADTQVKFSDATHPAFQELIAGLHRLKGATNDDQKLAALRALQDSEKSMATLALEVGNNQKLVIAAEETLRSLELNISEVLHREYFTDPALDNMKQVSNQLRIKTIYYGMMSYLKNEEEITRTLTR